MGARDKDGGIQDAEVLTVSQAAAFLNIGKNSLYDAINRGQVPHRRIGKNIRLSRAALLLWLASWSSQVSEEG